MDKAIAQRMETSATDLRRQFRDNKIKFNSLALNNNTITFSLPTMMTVRGNGLLRRNGNEFNQQALATDTGSTLTLTYTDATARNSVLCSEPKLNHFT
jgi:preprotein translocase subunit SecD